MKQDTFILLFFIFVLGYAFYFEEVLLLLGTCVFFIVYMEMLISDTQKSIDKMLEIIEDTENHG